MERVIAIIFAGGSGVRMGAGKPKQFLEVDGRPIIIHTLDIFEESPTIDEIYIACKEDYIDKLKKLVKRYDISKVKDIVPGGTTALGSAYNALKAAKKNNDNDAIVLIHDGVRPCIGNDLIETVVEKTCKYGAVVTCTPLYETPVISKSGEFVDDSPKRSDCYTAQAPQSFRLGEILAAHDEVRENNPEYTDIVDSCTLMRSIGKRVALVNGPRGNIKVTTPEDLYIFMAMLDYQRNQDAFGINN
ncbi:MAG: 2-C-methyl-D-erythritol 4-phosphate cytidylyltransferase [Mogibacterium sp.]|nr:2-C-methyl-D-erythritol 4-phosphate cytidylyltransferase [Mogibacterium sp.]